MKDKIKPQTKAKIKLILKTLFEFFMVAVGCFIMALSFNIFCVPHHLAPGGFSGIAAIVYYTTGFPAGVVTFVLSVPWFFLLLKGKGFLVFFKSLFGTVMFSLFIDLTATFSGLVEDIFLSALYGGVIMGVGIGIVLSFKGTTGGTDLVAALLHNKFSTISVGVWLLIIDCCVVVMAGVILNQIEVALYSAIIVYVCMKVIELMQNGFDYNKAFYIITDKSDEIKNAIFAELDRGVTFIKANGGFSGAEQNILLCVVSRLQISTLKSIIRKIDSKAFVFVADVNEVFGEGFDTD